VDGTGTERCVQARYIKDYPVGNNDWGDFQTHRRLLGLITICKCYFYQIFIYILFFFIFNFFSQM
jgi:hypothetical protein